MSIIGLKNDNKPIKEQMYKLNDLSIISKPFLVAFMISTVRAMEPFTTPNALY